MCEDIPYGPDRKAWKETVSPLAINGKELYISPPSQDPLKLYSFPKLEKGITPPFYQVPSEGLSKEDCRQAQGETVQRTLEQTTNHLGYQASLGQGYVDVVPPYLDSLVLNNIGDPIRAGHVHTQHKMDGKKCVGPLCFFVEC